MPEIRDAVLLTVDPESAWRWLTDPELLPRWMGGLVALHWGRLAPDELGRSFVLERTWGQLRHRHPAVVTAWEPPRQLEWEILQDQLTVHRRTTLRSEGQGTRVEVVLELRPETVIARAGLPWFRREARQRLQAELQRLAGLAT